MRVEKRGARQDLPNEWFDRGRKPPRQREKSLCYTDAVLHTDPIRVPRVLIEVVDSSPTNPHGITGLVVNADRIAGYYKEQGRVDLLFVVLSELKRFYCQRHARPCRMRKAVGHKFWKPGDERTVSTGVLGCFKHGLITETGRTVPIEVVIDGSSAKYRKALKTYPIEEYLRHMPAPSVLFLNSSRIRDRWGTYKARAVDLIHQAILKLLDAAGPLPWNVDELVPEEFWEALGL
jgi:hypothetical protein